MKPIPEMVIGEIAIIVDMNKMDKVVRHRFMDLGIAPTAQIKLLNTISFNRLYILEVDDVEICIRLQDAKNIFVQGKQVI